MEKIRFKDRCIEPVGVVRKTWWNNGREYERQRIIEMVREIENPYKPKGYNKDHKCGMDEAFEQARQTIINKIEEGEE